MGASSLLLILAIHVIQNQGLQLHQIKRNPGILPLREGYAVVSNDTWRVIKVLDLKLIYDDLEFNINSYLSFRNQVHSCIDIQALGSDFITTELQTDYHMNYTIDKFEQLIPSSRSKRGLLNPLGSVIKIITGNLDNEDAIQFENTIEKLKTKQDSIIHKMTIVTEMVGSLLNVAEISNNNFIAIQNKLNVIDSLLNDTNLHQRTNEIIHTYSAFLHNFMSLYVRLSEIETAVAFSKIKLLHQSVVDTKELLLLLKNIETSSKLPFPVNLDNVLKIEQLIEVQTYVKQSQIKFVMTIPLITDDIYSYFKIIPLPIFNEEKGQTSLILPKYPYVLVKGLKTMPLSQPCKEIDEDRFLCPEILTSTLYKDDCLADLLRLSTNVSSCQPIPISIDDVKIDNVLPNRWILYVNVETVLTKVCENEVTQEFLHGTYLLTLDETGCYVKIGDITLKKYEVNGIDIIYPSLPKIILPNLMNFPTDRKPVNLKGANLTDINMLRHLIENSENSENQFSSTVNSAVGVINIITFVLIVIIIVIVVVIKSKLRKICIQENPSDFLETEDGGVMSGQPAVHACDIVFVNAA
ncbi:uncharacterized protein LOC123698101 [Colias croceus]|uniref:uncharacterized protein LOC123698101 n=1 Tax=Colias crocea TaxID=72248 RepID=UPI001E27F62C|nr:uncharacterized protein LOC123698101 [Colias croceus]